MVLNIVLSGGLIFAVGAPARANQDYTNDCQERLVPGQDVQQPAEQAPIRVKAKLVGAPVPVSNSRDELVPELTKDNGRVYDNAVKQPIESPDTRGTPLSVVMVVETSSRVEGLLPTIRHTGILLTQDVLGPDGEAAVIGYSDEVDRLLDFTSDDDAIEKAVGNIQIGTSGTHLFDALSQAVILLRARSSPRRRVIVVLAEAANSGSEQKLDHVIREVQISDITIYAVRLSSIAAELRGPQEEAATPSATPPGTFALPPVPGTPQTPTTEAQLRTGNINIGALAVWGAKHATAHLHDNPMEIAAEATEGLYVSTFSDSSIEPALDKIGGELHAQ